MLVFTWLFMISIGAPNCKVLLLHLQVSSVVSRFCWVFKIAFFLGMSEDEAMESQRIGKLFLEFPPFSSLSSSKGREKIIIFASTNLHKSADGSSCWLPKLHHLSILLVKPFPLTLVREKLRAEELKCVKQAAKQ